MQIEQLKDIHAYLQSTADELERVTRDMAGHLAYLQRHARADDAQDVNEQIQGLRASVKDLRGVFAHQSAA